MELLAPCGTIQALYRAVQAGADAVYLGLGKLNARAKSTDFDLDNLAEHVGYCHLYGVKVYVTVNVEVFQTELDLMRKMLDCILKAGADAVIACDLAVIAYALKIGLPVHVSTQAGVHTVEGAKFFAEMGVKRVVLSREYAIKDAKAIADLGLEVEVFVHGALCVSFSGGCLLSSYIGGESGNRGRCKQPCRQVYTAYDMEGKRLDEAYLISPKDLAYDGQINELQKAGVCSLKIEGRLKRPEYVGAVTGYYRALLDGEHPNREQLLTIYNRGGFSQGYYGKEPIIYKKDPTHIGIEIGTVVGTLVKGGFLYAKVKSDRPILKGDGLKIVRADLVVGGADVTSVSLEGGLYVIPVSAGVKVGDKVRLTTSVKQLKEVADLAKKIPCNMLLNMRQGEPAELTVDGVSVTGDVVGDGRMMTKEEIVSQLSKTGNTPFAASSIDVVYQGGYLPKSALNALRNKALDALAKRLASREPLRLAPKEIDLPKSAKSQYSRVVELDEIQDVVADAVVLNPTRLEPSVLDAMLAKVNSPAFVKIPRVMVGCFDDIIQWASSRGVGLYADNVATVWAARQLGLPYIAGIGLNVTNDFDASMYCDAVMVLASPECEVPPKGCKLYGGAIPLMTWAHCPWQTVTGKSCRDCKHKGESMTLESKGMRFVVKPTVGKRCIYTMYAVDTLPQADYINMIKLPKGGNQKAFNKVQ